MNPNVKKILLNKYLIATLLFLAVIVFIDDYSLRVSSRLRRPASELR